MACAWQTLMISSAECVYYVIAQNLLRALILCTAVSTQKFKLDTQLYHNLKNNPHRRKTQWKFQMTLTC
jgi:hypothetical protein